MMNAAINHRELAIFNTDKKKLSRTRWAQHHDAFEIFLAMYPTTLKILEDISKNLIQGKVEWHLHQFYIEY